MSLLVLRQIERFLGPELPLQLFFDLIVGTRFVILRLLSLNKSTEGYGLTS